MARAPWFDGYEVAQRFVDRCLKADGSYFADSDQPRIWSAESAEGLFEAVGIPDESKGDFMGKLEKQLAGAAPEVVQLAAELVCLELLGEKDTGPAKKAEHVNRILSWRDAPIPMPGDVEEALSFGIAEMAGGKIYRDFFIRFLVRFIKSWKSVEPNRRDDLLKDPWAFGEFVSSFEVSTADKRQSNTLVHLVFPSTFGYVTSPDHRNRVVDAFSKIPGFEDSANERRRVEFIERSVQDSLGRSIGPYEDPYLRVWWSEQPARWAEAVSWGKRFFEWDEFDKSEREYKLRLADIVRSARDATVAGHESWRKLLRGAFGATENNVTNWQAHGKFLDWLDANEWEGHDLLVSLWKPEEPRAGLEAFLDLLPPEAASGTGTRLMLATYLLLGSDPYSIPLFKWTVFTGFRDLVDGGGHAGVSTPEGNLFRPEELAARLGVDGRRLRQYLRETWPRELEERNADWLLDSAQVHAVAAHFGVSLETPDEIEAFDQWVMLLEELQLRLLASGVKIRDLLDAQSVAWSILKVDAPKEWGGDAMKELEVFRTGESATPELPPSIKAGLISATAELAAKTFLPQDWLQSEIVDLLEAKKQLIFHGPPGTGKTFVAQEVAKHIASGGGEARLVQFHPSYTYEDFFEGFRPSLDGEGSLSYQLVHGPLRQMAAAAEADPDQPYVLIIDEINRGNMAKIFGELFFLLEYRDRSIQLQYSRGEEFSMPPNLYVIGTMNTADRSIALIDSAMRRRFYFVGFIPTEEPVRSVLECWLDKKSLNPEAAQYLTSLNAEIADDDFSVGPAFFMGSESDSPNLDLIWKHSLKPILNERYYGSGRDLEAEFGPNSIMKKIADSVDKTSEESSDEHPDDPH